MRPIAGNALAHGTSKGLQGPYPDSGLGIRSEVAPINDPERRIHPIPASERLSIGTRMTRRAMSRCGEGLALSTRADRETLRNRVLYGSNHRPPRQKQQPGQREASCGEEGDRDAANH